MSVSAPSSTPRSAIGCFTADAFNAHLASLAGAPAWWLERKRAAYEKFAALPLPTRTDEAWRFSSLQGLTLEGFHVGTPAEATSTDRRNPDLPAALARPDLAFTNNHVSTRPATPRPAGVIVSTLTEAAASHADLLKAHFMAQPQKLGSEKFAALHAAFVRDGAFVYVPRGIEVDAPIVIHHLVNGPAAAIFPHTLVIAEENTKVTVIDLFFSDARLSLPGIATSVPHFACGANDLYAAHGAQLNYIGAQAWSYETLSLQLNSTVVRRDARVQSLNLHLGGRQSRHESLSQLQAPGAFSEMLALTVADGTQEFDQRTLQIHQAPDTKSDLLYKNSLRDKARTIFSGLIVVDPDAQRTDAYQSNRNLMLSEEAEANSLPGLEIQANDVRCTHGATSSRIDPEQEFYLQTRGIRKDAADKLLTFGFFEEVLNRLTNDELHAALRALIETQFE
jgi:Fe-S cluster assembly protein SufD